MPASARAGTHIALLRGVNVGGKHRVPMAELRTVFEEAGAERVRTYIQSGNIVFDASPGTAAVVARRALDLIRSRLGLAVPVVFRTGGELERAASGNPYWRAGVDPAHLHVAFLAEPPARDRAAALDPGRSPGDSFALMGRELYLHLPGGVARTKLTSDYLDRTLGVISTVRNWRTVEKLRAMAAE